MENIGDLGFLAEQGCYEERLLIRDNRAPVIDRSNDTPLLVLRNRQGLYEDLKYVISLPDLCDVTFLVGEERKPVYGVRAILATRSRVFHQLILSQLMISRTPVVKKKSHFRRVAARLSCVTSKSSARQTVSDDVIIKLTIPIRQFDPETFDRLMSYVHCGSMTVDATTVIGLLNAAQEFGFPELRKACWDFAVACVAKTDHLKELFESAKLYAGFKLTKLLMQTLRVYTSDYPDLLQHYQTLGELADDILATASDDSSSDDTSSTSSTYSVTSSWSASGSSCSSSSS